jgi:D-xylose transport system substrate-binding protein
MAKLAPLVKKGKGSIGVILPDTTSSARYTEFDAPYLKKAFEKAGLKSSQFSIQNAHGSDSTFITDAKADITNGASVLVTDPEDSGTGAQVEKYAKQHGVTVVDYDRLTLGGNRDYYISFDNVKVGKLIGQGFADCTKAWGVKNPILIEMRGDPTDNNAKLFAQGYESVIKKNPSWKVAAKPAGTWTPKTAQTEFTQALTAHKDVNSAIIPNDENAAPIISYLKNQGTKAKTFPITGQDATLVGLQNILAGYQCGTAYKPIYLEAQAAAAVALYARAGQKPPSGLANGTTQDSKEKKAVPSVLLKPEWVTTKNMNDTVIADKFVPAKQLCKGHEKQCKSAGISG